MTEIVKIKCDDCKFVEDCVDYGWEGCKKFTQKQPHTNEEWLRTATTEQLAEFLCNVGFENETIVRKFKSEWVKWLKQPHQKE